jgi:hypothetical protein
VSLIASLLLNCKNEDLKSKGDFIEAISVKWDKSTRFYLKHREFLPARAGGYHCIDNSCDAKDSEQS